jgi:LysM repeat protein
MGSRFLSLAFASLLAGLLLVAPRAEAKDHVVASGQTLARIAKRYNVTLDELCSANGLKKGERLHPGTRLVIPSKDDPAPSLDRESSRESARESSRESAKDLRDAAEPSRSETAKSTSSTKGSRDKKETVSSNGTLRASKKPGWVHIIGYHGEFHGPLLSPRGILLTKGADAVSRILAWPRHDYRMDSRLLTLLARTSDSFGGRPLRIVSGFRTSSYSSESKHPLGRACDFSVLGVTNETLRDAVRKYPRVGVGYYPNSSFVHLDVREGSAYWIDYAGPGEPPRVSPRPAQGPDPTPRAETPATEAATTAATEPAATPTTPLVPDPAEPLARPTPEAGVPIAHATTLPESAARTGDEPPQPPASEGPRPGPQAATPAPENRSARTDS